MDNGYISPSAVIIELVSEMFCQSIEQYTIGDDSYDDDSD